MTAHLRIICGGVQILVPASCVTSIAPWNRSDLPLPPSRRMPRSEPLLDARVLFPLGRLDQDAVAIRWHSADGAHAATILVDRASWHDDAGGLTTQPLPRLPALAAGLFDAAITEGNAVLLRLREDAGPNNGGHALLRRLRHAAVDGPAA